MFILNRVTFAPDDPPAAGGDSGDAGNQGPGNESLGWRAALPDEFKDHDFVKQFTKPGDFVKTALEMKTEHDGLKSKLDNAIFKPGEDASDEDRAAFYQALGVPESADGYEFPQGENVEHDERMVDWAKSVFHEAKLTPEQGKTISQAWDGFVAGLAQAEEESRAEGIKSAESALKKEWGADYDTNIKVTQRGYQAFEQIDPQFKDLLDVEVGQDVRLGNHPVMLKVFHAIGKSIGDDMTLPSRPSGKPPAGATGGFQSIYKTPNPSR